MPLLNGLHPGDQATQGIHHLRGTDATDAEPDDGGEQEKGKAQPNIEILLLVNTGGRLLCQDRQVLTKLAEIGTEGLVVPRKTERQGAGLVQPGSKESLNYLSAKREKRFDLAVDKGQCSLHGR